MNLSSKKRPSLSKKNTIGVWMMLLLSQSSSGPALTLGYTTLTTPGRVLTRGINARKRTQCKSSSNTGFSLRESRLSSSLRMSLDSRELRFYAASQSPVARAGSGVCYDRATVTNTVFATEDGVTTATTTTSTSRTAVTSTTTTSTSSAKSISTATFSSESKTTANTERHLNLESFFSLSSTSSPAISLHNSGIAGIINSFDSEFKRAFSLNGISNLSSLTSLYSTSVSASSSTLFNSKRSSFNAPNGVNGKQRQTLQQRQLEKLKLQDNVNDVRSSSNNKSDSSDKRSPIQIDLTDEEQELFDLLRTVTNECGMKSTLRVAGGWVRDKLLASKEFKQQRVVRDMMDLRGPGDISASCATCSGAPEDEKEDEEGMKRITSKFKGEKHAEPTSTSPNSKSLTVTTPVDIDIALDDKLGREFADELNSWLSSHGRETHSVGVVLKNPEKSKHLETATMRVNNYWIDFVNLRAEEYTSDSRIPDLMRIGTAEEDALRRDLTINSLFYNINEGLVEDMTGRGLEDLRRGVVATPLPPLTTLLDDPLRVLRSVRFAARLRFGMAESLRKAASDERVRVALAQKVSRERVGSEVDLMLKSRDPVGAMRLLMNLGLIHTVFPLPGDIKLNGDVKLNGVESFSDVFDRGLALLSTAHDHLCDCMVNPPLWCEAKRALEAGAVNGIGQEETRVLMEDEDARRLLWYAAFLKPLRDKTIDTTEDFELERKKKPRKSNRSVVIQLLVNELKRPMRDADAIDKIMRAADGFTNLVSSGSDISAMSVLLSGAHVVHAKNDAPEGDSSNRIICTMNHHIVDPNTEDDPVWQHCMEFRLGCADVLRKIGPLWRAAFILSLCEKLVSAKVTEVEYAIEGDVIHEAQKEIINGILTNYDAFAAAIMQLGLIGIWNQQPLFSGEDIKKFVLPNIPKGPVFRDVMEAQTQWMTIHPGGSREKLEEYLRSLFPDFV